MVLSNIKLFPMLKGSRPDTAAASFDISKIFNSKPYDISQIIQLRRGELPTDLVLLVVVSADKAGYM